MWKFIVALSLAAVIAPVQAKPGNQTPVKPFPEPEFKYQAALERVDRKVVKLIGEEKQKTLRELAIAAVLSDYCAAVDLDTVKFTKTFDALAVSQVKVPPAEQRNLEHNLMTYFGVYVGLLIAESTDRENEFCSVAETLKREKRPLSRFWLASVPTPPAPAPSAVPARR
jgi:hypothetical protein